MNHNSKYKKNRDNLLNKVVQNKGGGEMNKGTNLGRFEKSMEAISTIAMNLSWLTSMI
jgi:hypothetical protein